jgi:hypothetical protein
MADGLGGYTQAPHSRAADSKANAYRIQIVERCFGSGGQSLAKKGRVLLGEGTLWKVCRKGNARRKIFFFNDAIVFGHIIQDKKKVVICMDLLSLS